MSYGPPSSWVGSVESWVKTVDDLASSVKTASKEELDVISKRISALKKLVDEDDEVLAKHKIEIHFDKGRTGRDFFHGILLVFRTGVLSGGGDEVIYPCPDDNCSGYIDFDNRSTATSEAICSKCGSVWKEGQLNEIRGYKLDVNGWARVISKVFWDLGGDADIYVKTHWSDLRKAALKESIQERRGDDLYDARKRVVLRYSLGAILKDTSNGSSLESRVKGLLRA